MSWLMLIEGLRRVRTFGLNYWLEGLEFRLVP